MPHKETEEKLRKAKFSVRLVPGDGRHGTHMRPPGEAPGWSGGRRRVWWGLGKQGLCYGFCEKGKAGQGR